MGFFYYEKAFDKAQQPNRTEEKSHWEELPAVDHEVELERRSSEQPGRATIEHGVRQRCIPSPRFFDSKLNKVRSFSENMTYVYENTYTDTHVCWPYIYIYTHRGERRGGRGGRRE